MQKMKHAPGADNLKARQGIWVGESDHYQSCLIGGQEMLVASRGEQVLTYRLSYMNVTMEGFKTMDEAKEQAQAFSLNVLKLILQSAAVMEPVWISYGDQDLRLPHE
jgi:hypothetical protein